MPRKRRTERRMDASCLVLAYQIWRQRSLSIRGDDDLARTPPERFPFRLQEPPRLPRRRVQGLGHAHGHQLCMTPIARKQRRPTTPLDRWTMRPARNESPRWLASRTPSRNHPEQAEVEQASTLPEGLCPISVRSWCWASSGHGLRRSIQKHGSPLGTIKSRLPRRLNLRDCLRGFEELLPADFRLEREKRHEEYSLPQAISMLSAYVDGRCTSVKKPRWKLTGSKVNTNKTWPIHPYKK